MKSKPARNKKFFSQVDVPYDTDILSTVEELRLTVNRLGQDVLRWQRMAAGVLALVVLIEVLRWLV
jgi:hypothetical protein